MKNVNEMFRENQRIKISSIKSESVNILHDMNEIVEL